MRVGEIWKYKSWLVNLINNNIHPFMSKKMLPAETIRIVVKKIKNDNIQFSEINSTKKYSIKRESFIQIFEKDYDFQLQK